MDTLKLEANYRTDMSKSRTKALRKQGYVTGSVFGHDTEPVPIEMNLSTLAEQVKKADAGTKSLIDLKINDAPKKMDGLVIIKQFTKDPISKKVLDVQLQRVSRKEKVHVGIPIALVGEALGIKQGGLMEQQLDELQINCLPTDMPARIEVDITELEIGHHITAGDIKLDSKLELLTDPTAMVAACVAPHVRQGAAEEAAVETPPEAAPTATPAE